MHYPKTGKLLRMIVNLTRSWTGIVVTVLPAYTQEGTLLSRVF